MPALHPPGVSRIIWLGTVSVRHGSRWSISDMEGKFRGEKFLEFVEVL